MAKLVPEDFEVSELLKTENFILKKLTVDDVDKDFEAVSSSIDHLKGFFGPNSKWPEDITKEKDLEDLKWHEEEFEKKSSFAYTVLSLDEKECLGCFYIFPSRKKSFDVDVFYWVRKSRLDLDEEVGKVVRKWVKEKWPFKKVVYPGRDVGWEEYGLIYY